MDISVLQNSSSINEATIRRRLVANKALFDINFTDNWLQFEVELKKSTGDVDMLKVKEAYLDYIYFLSRYKFDTTGVSNLIKSDNIGYKIYLELFKGFIESNSDEYDIAYAKVYRAMMSCAEGSGVQEFDIKHIVNKSVIEPDVLDSYEGYWNTEGVNVFSTDMLNSLWKAMKCYKLPMSYSNSLKVLAMEYESMRSYVDCYNDKLDRQIVIDHLITTFFTKYNETNSCPESELAAESIKQRTGLNCNYIVNTVNTVKDYKFLTDDWRCLAGSKVEGNTLIIYFYDSSDISKIVNTELVEVKNAVSSKINKEFIEDNNKPAVEDEELDEEALFDKMFNI